MRKRFATLLLAACLLVGTTGCTITTTGEGSWEVYGGVRTKQHSEGPAKGEFESSVVDTIVDSLTDGEVSEAE